MIDRGSTLGPSVAALVLAGGESRRFGRPKQLADWRGSPLLAHVVEQARSWAVVDSVYVVLGASAEHIMDQVDFTGVTVIENLEWQEGLGGSLRAGLDCLVGERGIDQVLLVLGDQPLIPSHVPAALIESVRRSRRPVAVPRYRFTRGHPVLVHRSLWPTLIAHLRGDQGARSFFLSHPKWVEEVPVESSPPGDVDTVSDLEQLIRR